ncbi:MAG: ATP-grasp domain-containing protein [Lachnospiraceae bacterium]|nr:ATP-grasp domain-containing protein [Lachnospiraceae bacterium]
MNILLTSSGRRTYLVDYFKEALNGKGLLFASNSEMSPALINADKSVITPLIYSEEYIPFLLKFCKKNEVSLVVPLFDIDIPVLAAHRREFSEIGVRLAVSGEDVAKVCNDKYLMSQTLREYGIPSPKTVLSPDEAAGFSFPCIVKPRFGMGSIGVEACADVSELSFLYERCRKKIGSSYLKYESEKAAGDAVLIQEMIMGDEYGLDVINDLDGNYVTTVVKRKLAMRAGETDEAVTLSVDLPEYGILKKLGEKIGKTFRHIGNMDVDVMVDENGTPYVIDMNARFGGGYPFSHAAGVNLPKAYVMWAMGMTVPKEMLEARPNVHSFKEIAIRTF